MKWVKVAIGAVIAIAVVPMIAISVSNLTQEKVREEVVTFEVLTLSTVTNGTYNLIDEYVIFDFDEFGAGYSSNVISVKVNDDTLVDGSIGLGETDVRITDDSGDYDFLVNSDDTITSEGYNIQVGDVWEITFEVTQAPILSGISATLLLLAPLIFVSGILYFIYNNKQEGI